jgi:hypothetical protein
VSIHNFALTTDFGWDGVQPITDVIDPAQLSREIEASSIGRAPDSIMADEDADDVEIIFTPDLTGGDITTLGVVVAAHVPTDPVPETPTEGTPGTISRPYTAGVVVRDLVYQKSDGTVDRASATTVATSVLAGFVEQIDVPSSGLAVVRYLGDLDGFAGLTVGDIYILGKTVGTIVRETDTGSGNYPDQTPQSGHTRYKVGLAASATKLWVDISRGFDEF